MCCMAPDHVDKSMLFSDGRLTRTGLDVANNCRNGSTLRSSLWTDVSQSLQ